MATLKMAARGVARAISHSEAQRRGEDTLARIKAEHKAAMARLSAGKKVRNILSGQEGVVVAKKAVSLKKVRVNFDGKEMEVNPTVLEPME